MIYVLCRGESLQAPCGKNGSVIGKWPAKPGFERIPPDAEALGMWESLRDFQEEWEGWEAGILAFHAFHSSAFPALACRLGFARTLAFDDMSVYGDLPERMVLRSTAGIRILETP